MVFDEQDGQVEVAPHLADKTAQLGLLGRVHAGRRLVQQQDTRLEGQGARDLQAALVAVGEVARLLFGAVGQPHQGQQFKSAGAAGLLLGRRGRQAQHTGQQARPRVDVLGNHHVHERRQVAEQADILEGAGDALRRDLVGPSAEDVLAVVQETAGAGRGEAGHQVEDSRLTRPVRPNQAKDFALVDLE